jgi:hypothetical protein
MWHKECSADYTFPILYVFVKIILMRRYCTHKLYWELPFHLPLHLSGCTKLAWACVLLTLMKTLVEYTVSINDLPVQTVNYFVKSACPGVNRCWCVLLHAILWASDRRIGVEQMFSATLYRNRLSFQFPLPLFPHLGTKITCLYSKTTYLPLNFTLFPVMIRFSSHLHYMASFVWNSFILQQ